MKFILGLFFMANAVFLHAQSADLLVGNWKYEDVYEKEKIDSVGLKMLPLFFGDMTFSFEKDGHYQASMMQKREEGVWKLDENTKSITLTSSKGKTGEMEVLSVAQNSLIIRVGKGTFIMGRY